MKPHLTLSTTSSQRVLDQGNAAEGAPDRPPAGESQAGMSVPTRPQLTLANGPVWRHKLILAGALDHRSASELEEEIECLCEEGVTTLTLDLRQLDEIDSTGVTAIARRGAVCKMRGHDFAVIPGSRGIRRALTAAGATDLLSPDLAANAVSRFPAYIADAAACRSTVMIKSL